MNRNCIYLCELIESSHTYTIKFSFILCLKTLPHNTETMLLLYSFTLVPRELKIQQTSSWHTVSSQLKTCFGEYAFSFKFYNSARKKTTASFLKDTTFPVIFILFSSSPLPTLCLFLACSYHQLFCNIFCQIPKTILTL